MDFRGKRVTVVGLGIEGVDGVRFFVGCGAHVTVTDVKPADQLAHRLAQIEGLPVRLFLGGHDPAALEGADYVYVSQGVPLDLPIIDAARRRGIPIVSMLSLYMELCPGPIAAITGSSGKTTTTALVGRMMEAEGLPHLVGGNIGVGLLSQLPRVRPYTWSILEVSHTQLQHLRRSPHVGAVLNITPNHLDRFTWEEYKALKARMVSYLGPGDWAVLGYDDAEARALAVQTGERAIFFSLRGEVERGVGVRKGKAWWFWDGRAVPLFDLSSVQLRGEHNLQNALAAAAVARLCGVSGQAIACAVATFQGVEHRLELVATVDGVAYYNDSIATTPQRALAALRSFQEPIVLLLGGRDKNLPLEELAEEALRRCRAVVVFGQSGPKLEAALREAAGRGQGSAAILRVEGLSEAVEVAQAVARPGDVVLLSPACTSYDAYQNFEERGQHFRELVGRLARAEVAAWR
jgi:UDP-N-acetylmuramoylalanine--D-glutamate ligase